MLEKLTGEETVVKETPKEGQTPKETPKEVKKVVVVEKIDPVALANANRLAQIFPVDEKQKKVIYKWVVSKKNHSMEYLVNAFIDERANLMK